MKVAIRGQFNTDNPYAACGNEEAQVDRTALLSPPRNWNTFCDAADEALKSVTAAKKFWKVFGGMGMVLIFALIIGVNILMRTWIDFTYSMYMPLVFIPFFVFYLYVYCATRSKVRSAMSNIGNICTQYSGNGVQYRVSDEHWGGCNKPHVRRYFIFVTTDTTLDAESPESFPSNPPVVAAEPVYAPSSTQAFDNEPTSSNNGSTSMFDQLKM